MKNFLTMLAFLALAASNVQAQSLTTSYLSCNSFQVDFSGTLATNLYAVANTVNCGSSSRRIAGNKISGASYQLQQRSGNGSFVNVGSAFNSDLTSKTYNNLGVGIYRVVMSQRLSGGFPVYSYFNPCMTGFIGANYGFSTTWISDEIEIGTPVPNIILNPAPFGTPPSICWSWIDQAHEPLYLNGINSFGERAYHIAVFKDNLSGQNVGYASTGWVDGKLLTNYNLKELNMVFEPGYSYTVQLALSQLPCTGWVDQTTTFRISTLCREDGEVAELSVYPNPTSDVLNFEGLESWNAEEISVTVLDLFGKKVMDASMKAPEFSISLADLPKGTYMVQVRDQEHSFTKKVVRL